MLPSGKGEHSRPHAIEHGQPAVGNVSGVRDSLPCSESQLPVTVLRRRPLEFNETLDGTGPDIGDSGRPAQLIGTQSITAMYELIHLLTLHLPPHIYSVERFICLSYAKLTLPRTRHDRLRKLET